MCKALSLVFIFYSFFLSAQGVGVGKRIDMTTKLTLDVSAGQFAQLFIPDYFTASQDGKFLLVFHLHSASWAAEDEVYKSNTNAVLFNIHLGGFSSSYQNYFSNQDNFQKILDLLADELSTNNIVENPQLENLIITSFSAGYGGVREILKTQIYYDKIDALILADGLHSNLESSIMREQMKDFLRFATDARDKKKVMLLTHSNILTYTYANTTETAGYLIENIHAERENYNSVDEIGTQYSRADSGSFHVRGYRGTTAEDHLKHLYNMNIMLQQAVDILNRPTGVGNVKSKQSFGFNLLQNYPNPFNPNTKIKYSLPAVGTSHDPSPQNVTLKVYDILGREVTTLVNKHQQPGNYDVSFSASHLSSGTYFYRLTTDEFEKTMKMALVK